MHKDAQPGSDILGSDIPGSDIMRSDMMNSVRAILYHKQSTSAMTRFLKMDDAGVCLGGGGGSRILAGVRVVVHPASVATLLEQWLGLQSGALAVETQYQECLEIGGLSLPVYLLRFTTIDPPFEAAEAVGASFITLTQARSLPAAELELLCSAYAMIMEG